MIREEHLRNVLSCIFTWVVAHEVFKVFNHALGLINVYTWRVQRRSASRNKDVVLNIIVPSMFDSEGLRIYVARPTVPPHPSLKDFVVASPIVS